MKQRYKPIGQIKPVALAAGCVSGRAFRGAERLGRMTLPGEQIIRVSPVRPHPAKHQRAAALTAAKTGKGPFASQNIEDVIAHRRTILGSRKARPPGPAGQCLFGGDAGGDLIEDLDGRLYACAGGHATRPGSSLDPRKSAESANPVIRAFTGDLHVMDM